MSNSKYCCYRHQTQGKHSKSCTYCNSHVPLGVINPPPSGKNQIPNNQPDLIIVASKPFRIENRTHDRNEIENKNTMPSRLTNPKIYIEKLVEKGQRSNPLLTTKLSSAHDYERIVDFYEQIGNTLQKKTKHCLRAKINEYLLCNGRSIKDKMLLIQKQSFIQLVGNCFKMGQQQGQQFWGLAYRDGRFNSHDDKKQISMEAFIYNFQKYYISTLNFTNMFSEPALRQRMIDIRLNLHDWKKNNIRAKLFMKWQALQQKQLLNQIDKEQSVIANRMFNQIERRQLTYITLRTLAKVLYSLTDDKFLTYAKVEKVVVEKVKKLGEQLAVSRKLVTDFIQNEQLCLDDEFEVTKIIEYLKDEGVSEDQMQIMVKWIRGVFKFLYFHKHQYQMDAMGITYNYQSMNLHCQNILKISPKIVTQFDQHLKKTYDMIIFILGDLMQNIDAAMAQIPVLEGPKKSIVQCNYVAESILRYINNLHFDSFYRINLILHCNGDISQMDQILNKKVGQNQIRKELKKMFSFSPYFELNKSVQYVEVYKNTYNDVIEEYKNMGNKMQQMGWKKRQKSESQEKQGIEKSRENSKRSQKIQQKQKDNKQKIKEDEIIVYKIENSQFCCSSRQCCSCVSLDTKESISTVENLQSQLFELLQM